MGKNKTKYEPFVSKWEKTDWENYCLPNRYRIVKPEDLPNWYPEGLKEKMNNALVLESGIDYSTYMIQGNRIDNENIDEHQYIISFDEQGNKIDEGFIEHTDYEGRTKEISPEMKCALEKSGISVDFHFNGLPQNETGSLDDLIKQNLIMGFEYCVNITKILSER
ncbi:MAG: hypothetical protein QXD23_03830 [Candidatus Micrarchaeaceae archaeon]